MGKFNKPAPSLASSTPECCSSAPSFAGNSCECHDDSGMGSAMKPNGMGTMQSGGGNNGPASG